MTENNDKKREEIFSRTVRAGKRTYFFDVKATKKGEYYLTITESKRRFSNEQGKFFYEKFKIFLYKEDFEKFEETIGETIKFILKNNENNPSVEDIRKGDDEKVIDTNNDYTDDSLDLNTMNVNVEFEDLGNENE